MWVWCVRPCGEEGTPGLWTLSPALGRARLRFGHAEAPVLLRGQQQAPGARRPDPEHLVPPAGAGAPEPVRGEEAAWGCVGPQGVGSEGPEQAVVVVGRKRAGAGVGGARAQEVCGPILSVSGAGRPPWRSCSPCTRSGTCSSMAPTRSAASNWTMGSWQVGTPMAPGTLRLP